MSDPIRILCLHGSGSNAKIFQAQTAALRYELGDRFEWVFVEGSIPVPMHEELKGIFPETEQCYAFFDHDEPRSMVKAIDDLETYIDLEGPFPFIGAQSSGASLAASLLFHKAETDPAAASLFKCAMFFSAVTPFDYQALSMNKAKAIEPNENDNLMLCIPTVNVWGHNDKFHADQSSKLSQLCAKEFRQDIIHSENSSIPGAGDEEILIRTVHAIRRAADQTEVF